MLKLLKYEFRKNRTALLVMLGIAAVLFLMAPLGIALEREELMIMSVFFLFWYCFASYILVLVRGVTAYSHELRHKTGYLLMMIPRSTTAILFSKLLFTVFFGFVMLGICVAALIGSGSLMLGEIYEVKGLLNIMKYAIEDIGVPLKEIAMVAVAGIASLLISVISTVSACYLACTLSATALQNRKGRGIITVLLALVLLGAVNTINEIIVSFIPAIPFESGPVEITIADGLINMLPSFIFYLVCAILFTWLSAVLLKKKVSL